jgi:hypothetical protein
MLLLPIYQELLVPSMLNTLRILFLPIIGLLYIRVERLTFARMFYLGSKRKE